MVTRANHPTDDAPETNDPNDHRFADVADRLATWPGAGQAAPDPSADLPAFVPTLTPAMREYARGLFDGAEIKIESAAELREENRQLRAHIRQLWFEAQIVRHDLLEPSRHRRDMILGTQQIIDRCAMLLTRHPERWWWVDVRGVYDAPRRTEEGPAYPWKEASEQAHAAFDAFLALVQPTGPRTPGYQERKAQMDAIRKAAVKWAHAQYKVGKLRGRCGE